MTASPIKDKKKLKDEIKDLISQKKVAFLIGRIYNELSKF